MTPFVHRLGVSSRDQKQFHRLKEIQARKIQTESEGIMKLKSLSLTKISKWLEETASDYEELLSRPALPSRLEVIHSG